ncbi:MAG: hypothetical protein JO223_14240, partial [Hyphomicrobiales bacterium]|nr:hypothetical protein [Hyphomicrobiales bacterium]
MASSKQRASTVAELLAAASDVSVREIVLVNDLVDARSFRLSPGQTLRGDGCPALAFAAGEEGVELSTDNRVESLELRTEPHSRAVFNDVDVDRLGELSLRDLRVTGVVQILARDRVRSGHVEARKIEILAADARGYDRRPKGYGVEIVSGAFTLWNQHDDPGVTITASLTGLTAGRPGAPVNGGGIFVAGGGDNGGRLIVRSLETGAVHSDGGIAPGVPDRISGGVFVVSGAFVDSVRNFGPVTTYGANDMVLDNWGAVDSWIADERVVSFGPSGIGFVNFGAINLLRANQPIETFGQGARGFNVYAGTVTSAEFDRIVTH